ncbi:MAG: hypothetical protein JWQ59_1239 [Cryobacterium sp.]|nr:hypothetical protein [Cryobacterium sp.]
MPTAIACATHSKSSLRMRTAVLSKASRRSRPIRISLTTLANSSAVGASVSWEAASKARSRLWPALSPPARSTSDSSSWSANLARRRPALTFSMTFAPNTAKSANRATTGMAHGVPAVSNSPMRADTSAAVMTMRRRPTAACGCPPARVRPRRTVLSAASKQAFDGANRSVCDSGEGGRDYRARRTTSLHRHASRRGRDQQEHHHQQREQAGRDTRHEHHVCHR